MATFRLNENGNIRFINLKEAEEKYEEIQSLINIQESLLNKSKTDYSKNQIETNIKILKDTQKNFKEELEKDPEYALKEKSDKYTEKYFNTFLKYAQ